MSATAVEETASPRQGEDIEPPIAVDGHDVLFGVAVTLASFVLIQPIASASVLTSGPYGLRWAVVFAFALGQLPVVLIAAFLLGFPAGLLLVKLLRDVRSAWMHATAFGMLGAIVGGGIAIPVVWFVYESISGLAVVAFVGGPNPGVDWIQVIGLYSPLIVELAAVTAVSSVIGWTVMFLINRRS